jgi:hypothetical protein
MECILAGSICGVLFSLFSGQPLNIISATGPMLILETIIGDMCMLVFFCCCCLHILSFKRGVFTFYFLFIFIILSTYNMNFMEFRLWIGIWTAVMVLLIVMFNLSFLVKYITRFTEDCFASLVAIIFVMDAIKSTLKLRSSSSIKMMSLSDTNNVTVAAQPNELEIKDKMLKKAVQEANFFFSFILFLMTFVICMGLKGFRNKPYLPTKVAI